MDVSGSSLHFLSINITSVPDIREILGLEGQRVILPASFYGSREIDITQNRQLNRFIHRWYNPPI